MSTPDHALSLVDLLAAATDGDTGPVPRPSGDRLPDEYTVVVEPTGGRRAT